MKKQLLLFLLCVLTATSIWAQTATPPATGDGSEGSPYEIATLENLYWLTQNSSEWGKYFIQTADIDASESSTWAGEYTPIGSSGTNFTGNYNGQNHTVTGLYKNNDGNDYYGLFGYTLGATIANVGVISPTFYGDDYIGGLVGYAKTTAITNCFAINVYLDSNDDYIGGLVGQTHTSSVIDKCYSTGIVVAGDDRAGGLVGYHYGSSISNSYSMVSVSGDSYVGGLTGYNYSTSSITNSYSIGAVVGNSNVGGFAGKSSGLTSCYYNSETSGQSDTGSGDPKTSAELTQQATFTDWDFASTWEISEGASYPGLQDAVDAVVAIKFTKAISLNVLYSGNMPISAVDNQTYSTELISGPDGLTITNNIISWTPSATGSYTVEYKLTDNYGLESTESMTFIVLSFAGDGSTANPYEISTLAQLKELSETAAAWVFNYVQTADIDAADTKTWNDGAGFSPIGSESISFKGSYNGKGHTINNLYINRPTTDYVALFGNADGVTLDSIALTNCDITGQTNTGALGGRINGDLISNSYTSGSVTGDEKVGGFIGKTYSGTIANCYAATYVNGNDIVGGLVGENKINLTNCYATGVVTSTGSSVGGLIATHSSSFVISSCYYNYELSGQSDTVTVLGIAKSMAEMKQQATFVGWDFTDSWSIAEDASFPCLKSVVDAPILVQQATKLSRINETISDTFSAIAMDNQSVSLEVAQGPEGMTMANGILTWTPTEASVNAITIKAVDANGVYATYSYVLSVVSMQGDGSAEFPYEISTIDQLKELTIVSTLWNSYFDQTADIDASGVTDFTGFGSSSMAFSGSYNGQGHTIAGLTINSDNNYSALFNNISGASIDSLGLINCSVTGDKYVGVLVGYAESSAINYCYTSGSVTGDENVGGLIGYISNTPVMYSNSRVVVSGLKNIGGLIGYNSGSTVSKCYAAGDVTAPAAYTDDYGNSYQAENIGGLIGTNANSTTTEYCYATGNVSNGVYVGGLIGNNNGGKYVTNSYATGSVYAEEDFFGRSYAGGFIGTCFGTSAAYITNCYSLGFVEGPADDDDYINGMIGYTFTGLTVTSCYYNTETSGKDDDLSRKGDPLTTAQMMLESSFVGWDFTTIWNLGDKMYPALISVENNAPFAFSDTLDVPGTAYVLSNDFDYESGQTNLLAKLVEAPTKGSFIAGYYSFNAGAIAGDVDSLLYRIGELTAVGDTLWGNTAKAKFVKVVNTAPVITAVVSKTINENTSVEITMGDITVTDTDGDKLELVVVPNSDFVTENSTVISPNYGFYGDLLVGIAVNDGELNSDTLTMTITVVPVPDTPELTWATPDTVVYGSAIGNAVMNAQTTGVGTLSYSFTADSVFNAGSYVLRTEFTPANSNDFNMVSTTVNYTVEKAMLTAKANNQTKTIDAVVPELTITYTGFANNETKSVLDVLPTASTVASTSSPVGNYAITVAGGSDNNYDFTYVEGILTVTEKTIPEITWAAPVSSVYGSAIGTSVMNAQASTAGTFTYSFAADSIFNAGTYQLTVEFVPTDNIQYAGNQATVEYTVTKAAITAKANDITVFQGTAIPQLTISYSGFVNDETIAVINALPTASTTATATSAVGEYPITVAGGSDNNYSFVYVPGTLTITDKMIPELTWESPASSVYGEVIGNAAMNAEATVTGTFAYSFTADSIFNAGTYQLQVIFTPDNLDEYVSVNKSVEYIVTKAMLTVTAENDTIFEGSEIPELIFSISGFVNNENESVLNVVPVATTSATANSPVGTYDIVVSGASDDNYKFTYVNGSLVIEKKVGLTDQDISVISIYPNPAKYEVNLTHVAKSTVNIFDITGQLIYTEKVGSETSKINVSNFNKGIYVISISNDRGTVSKRLIIE